MFTLLLCYCTKGNLPAGIVALHRSRPYPLWHHRGPLATSALVGGEGEGGEAASQGESRAKPLPRGGEGVSRGGGRRSPLPYVVFDEESHLLGPRT